ncbi:MULTISPECIES: alpha/beta hydrolase [Rhodomicrobium]|uniref:alpha/beta fold hydrolase n=1 Tax=Rhodomicrobium TaxID=1068 RepID=UPI000B4AFA94|nr:MULTISPECIES: alpha/beta hydrolase [Rhodomicrobium]
MTIDDPRGRIDYDETGDGQTIVFVPGSCSTGAAWRPVIAALGGRFRCVTTSLLGYGGTAERRRTGDASIAHEADIIEAVIRRAGGTVHLVGHSFGGLSALAVALRGRAPLASLTIAETPAVDILRAAGEHEYYGAFRAMTDAYFAAVRSGEREAIGAMLDFYGGAGSFASWPARVRAYAVETTPVNLLDWESAYGFELSPAMLAAIKLRVLVMYGGDSPAAVRRANALLALHIAGAAHEIIEDAAHFLISTHAEAVAQSIARHASGGG